MLAAVYAAACAGGELLAQAPLSVHDAVQRALNGPAVQMADAQVNEARGMVRQAGLRPNPRLYVQSEDLRPWAEDFSFQNATEDYAYVGQTVEVAGKRGKRVTLATARLRIFEADRGLRVRQVAAQVTSAYWNAVSLERIGDLLRKDMEAVDEMVRYHQERVAAGAMRGVDLLRMQIERDRLKIALEGAERDAAQARLELFRQMGVTPIEAKLSDGLESVPEIAPMDEDAALDQRPDVLAARDAVTAAQADLRLQKANAMPDPDLFGGYKRNSTDNTAYLALQLPLPVRNRNQGEIERARAAAGGAQASLALLEMQARLEIRQARASFEAQQRIVQETLPEMRTHARQNLDIVSEAYRIGGVDLLRYLDAERTEFDVEVSAMRTMAQLQQAAVQLQLAYGMQP